MEDNNQMSVSQRKTYEDLVTDLVRRGEDINKSAVEVLRDLTQGHPTKWHELIDSMAFSRVSKIEPRYRDVLSDYLNYSLAVSDTISKLSKVKELVRGDRKVKVGPSELQYILSRLSFVQSQENLTNTVINSIGSEIVFRHYTRIYLLTLLVSLLAVIIGVVASLL